MKGESRETSSDPPAISRSTDTERHVNKDSVHFVVHRELQNERVVYKNEQHVHNFTQELIQQRKDGFFCDVVIEVDGQRYWAHRAILAAGSAYFHAAFHSARPDNGDSNRQLQHMNLTTVDRGAFESVLYYIYSGDLLVSLATVSDLITVAGQLGVADVKQCCEFHMRKIIDINNWLDMYKICVMHNLEKLSMIVEDFIVTSFGVLAQEMELLQLPESYVQKILSRCNTERDNDIEGYILQVILKWVVFRYSDRVSCLDKLLSIVNAEILTKVHMDKILAIDAIQGHVILAQPNVMELLKEVKENDEKQKLEEERIRQEEEDFKMKEENSLREETHRLTIVEEEKAEKIKTHEGPVLNSNDSTNSHVANGAKSVSSDKNRKRLPIKKREDRTSHQMDAVTVKKENVSSEVVAAGENDSDTDTEWSEPLRKALLDLEQSTMKEEADGDKDATGRQSETKKQDQYPPKKRRKYVDHEAGDVLYSKVAPASSQEKTAKNCAGTPAVARTSARRKSSRPLKLMSHRTTRTSHTAAKTVNATPKNALKKTSKSVTTCTQTIEVPGEVVPPGEENLLQEQKVKVENGLEPAPRKRRGRKPGGSMHQCGKCHRTFTTPSALRHHMKGHGSETPFLCEVCGFATIHFASINVHKKQHNGNKFRCTFKDCTYTSIRRSRLEDHMNAHEGIKNFVCSICGKAFAGRKHMQRHEKIHEAIKPVSCGECDYRTTRKDKLRDHVKRHHPATAVLRGYISAYDVNKVKAPRRTSHAKRAASRPETDAQSPTHQVMSTAVVPHLVGTPTISEDMIQYLTSLATSQLQQQQQQQQQPVVGVFTPAMLAVTQPPVMSDQTAARQAPVNAATPVISTPETPAAHSNVQPPQSHVHTPQAHVLTQQTHAHTTQSHVQTPQRIMYVPQSHVQVPQALVRTALSQLQPPAHSQVAPQPSQLMTPQQIHVTPQPSHVAPQQSHVTPQQSNATPQQRYVTPQQSDVTQQAPWLYTLQQAQYSPYQQHAGQRQPAPVTPPCPVAPGAFKHNPS